MLPIDATSTAAATTGPNTAAAAVSATARTTFTTVHGRHRFSPVYAGSRILSRNDVPPEPILGDVPGPIKAAGIPDRAARGAVGGGVRLRVSRGPLRLSRAASIRRRPRTRDP